jgi:hypothetical protein
MAIRIRALTVEELEAIRRLAHSRTEPARTVERAKVVWLAQEGQKVPAIAQALHLSQATVRLWLKRFQAQGLAGLTDKARSACPPTYTPDQVSAVIAAALTNPQSAGGSKRLGSANGLIPHSPKKGAHRPALPRAARRQCDGVPG